MLAGLSRRIETLREQLAAAAQGSPEDLRSPRVLELSAELDQLIAEFLDLARGTARPEPWRTREATGIEGRDGWTRPRPSGIGAVGDVRWGAHLCQFYDGKADLVDSLVTYFKAGLENSELCMWVVSPPLTCHEAVEALRGVVRGLDSYLENGQMEVIPDTEWYLKKRPFDPEAVLNGWLGRIDRALARGLDGIRIAGNPGCRFEAEEWHRFIEYEVLVNRTIPRLRMIALCGYAADRCGGEKALDAVRSHQSILVRRQAGWELSSTELWGSKDAVARGEIS